MPVRIDLSQVRALARDIRRNGEQTAGIATRIVESGGHRTVAAIQANIQRLDLIDTGAMLNGTSVDVNGLRFEAGPTVDYAIYQELGTSEIAANNFTATGFDTVLPGIEHAVAELGAGIVDRT